MTVKSRTVDRTWAQHLNKKFDASGHMQELISAKLGGNKTAKLNLSFRNTSILHLTDEDLLRVRREVVKGDCKEVILGNINAGGRVCQTRAALRGDLVLDLTYQEGISAQEKGKLTGEVAASLNLEADQDRADRMLSNGLIYGVKLMPEGLSLNVDGKPVECRGRV